MDFCPKKGRKSEPEDLRVGIYSPGISPRFSKNQSSAEQVNLIYY